MMAGPREATGLTAGAGCPRNPHFPGTGVFRPPSVFQVEPNPMKTHSARKSEIHRKWFVVDAENAVLGRMASQVASILKGKHKPLYTPSMDTGDFVIVVNADKVKLTGNKETDKKYYRVGLQGKPGSLKVATAEELRARRPEDLVKNAVRRMLPRSPLGRQMFSKLKVYAGPNHPHEAQKPQVLELQA